MSIRERRLKDGTMVFDAVLEYGKKPDGTRDRQVKTFGTRKEAEAEERRAAIIRRALKSRTGRILLRHWKTCGIRSRLRVCKLG